MRLKIIVMRMRTFVTGLNNVFFKDLLILISRSPFNKFSTELKLLTNSLFMWIEPKNLGFDKLFIELASASEVKRPLGLFFLSVSFILTF